MDVVIKLAMKPLSEDKRKYPWPLMSAFRPLAFIPRPCYRSLHSPFHHNYNRDDNHSSLFGVFTSFFTKSMSIKLYYLHLTPLGLNSTPLCAIFLKEQGQRRLRWLTNRCCDPLCSVTYVFSCLLLSPKLIT